MALPFSEHSSSITETFTAAATHSRRDSKSIRLSRQFEASYLMAAPADAPKLVTAMTGIILEELTALAKAPRDYDVRPAEIATHRAELTAEWTDTLLAVTRGSSAFRQSWQELHRAYLETSLKVLSLGGDYAKSGDMLLARAKRLGAYASGIVQPTAPKPDPHPLMG